MVEGTLMKDNLGENLRSFVTNKQSISEGLEEYFQVHRLGQDKDQVLLYDMQSGGVPFFQTAYEMGKNLSFVTLNILALFTTGGSFCLDCYASN